LRERLQSGTAAARHREALKSRSVLIEPAEDGMADLTIHGAAPELVGNDHQLTKAAIDVAGRPGETRTIGQLRYDILFDLLLEGGRRPPVDPTDPRLSVPDRKGVEPQVGVLIPAMTLLGVSDVPATLAGYGPIDLETAERLAGKAKTWTRILTDPVTGTIVDIDRKRYRPPADLRRLATTLDGACRCGCGKRDGDLDHVQEWALHRGRTALDNLILLARRCHVMKTSGPWHLRLYPDRTLAWTSIWGTRIVTRPETDLEPTPVPSPGPPPATASPPPDADSDCPF
jgi:hypothetical protein